MSLGGGAGDEYQRGFQGIPELKRREFAEAIGGV